MFMCVFRRYKLHIATVLVVLLAAEGLSYATFALVIGRKERSFIYDNYSALRESITLEELQKFRNGFYDEQTGWHPIQNDHREVTSETGDNTRWTYTIDYKRARHNFYAAEHTIVSVYGDSFTFCDQVNDDQTWPYYLSQLTRSKVENWGVGAYGTDQALLRLKMNLPKYRTKIVVLGILSENIKRLMNAYRPFYGNSQHSMRLGFKPMLHMQDGKHVWLKNPLVYKSYTLDDYYRAYDKARQVDYWYALNQRKAVAKFPYTLALLQSMHYYVTVGPRPDLFKVDAAVEKLDHLLGEFQELAKRHNFIGVVLFIPTGDVLEQYQKDGTYEYREYVTRVQASKDLSQLTIVNIIEKPFVREKFNLRPYKYHASQYGNSVIAEAVYEAIKDHL